MRERLVILRDDDVNTTTPVERLERVYRPLLAEGHKITFATIPKVATGTVVPTGEREPFIMGTHGATELPLQRDTPIVGWLRENAALVEAGMHGLTHARLRNGTEFGSLTQAEAAARLDEGLKIMEHAFGKRPRSFIAPWDELSRGSIAATTERFDVVSTSFLNRKKLPASQWPKHFLERLRRQLILPINNCWVLRHEGGVRPDETADQIHARVRAIPDGPLITVIVLHHWMFWDKAEHPAVLALARDLKKFRTITLTAST